VKERTKRRVSNGSSWSLILTMCFLLSGFLPNDDKFFYGMQKHGL